MIMQKKNPNKTLSKMLYLEQINKDKTSCQHATHPYYQKRKN